MENYTSFYGKGPKSFYNKGNSYGGLIDNTQDVTIESVNIASFNTNIKKPLKSFVINIDPMQQGVGDPSPENVRPITGWTEAKIASSIYKPLDWIRGLQIQTNFIPKGKVVTIETEMRVNGWAQYGTWFRAYTDENTNAFRIIFTETNNSRIYFNIGTAAKNAGVASVDAPNWHKYKIQGSNNSLYIDNIVISSAFSAYGSTNTKALSIGRTPSTIFDTDFKYFKAIMNNTAELDMVPVTRTSDGTIGLYNFVDNIFYTNDITTVSGELSGVPDNRFTQFATPISWQTQAGTVYGGTLDVISGMLTVDRAMIASYAGEVLPSSWISDRDVYAAGTAPTTGAQVVYELATPVTYQLTPVEITTLLGENNVWADTGKIKELTYSIKK